MRKLTPFTLASMLVLTACGGSSDGELISPIDPPPPTLNRCDQQTSLNIIETSSAIEFVTEQSYQTEQAAAVIASIKDGNSQGLQFSWEQISGPSLTLKSIKSPVLAFQPSAAGEYSFSVRVSGNGLLLYESITLSVSNNSQTQLNVRSDHQVVEGNKVSFRADRVGNNADQVPADLNWCIASGPELNIDTTNPETPQFTAPDVDTDTLVVLRASGTFEGESITDEVIALITSEQTITSPYFDEPVARTFSYRENSPYKAALSKCVYSNQLAAPCEIQELPLLGQTLSQVDKDKIMDRLIVSHQWMGENFESFLEEMDPNSDFAKLLQSVTAVVISYDIRPSFYWVVTGAIYLDPSDLWLLAAERDVINEAADFRSSFGNELGFIMPWRYVKDDAYVSYTNPREVRQDRSFEDMGPDLASLLYHELAHANDFFPSSIHSSIAIDNQTLLAHYNQRTEAGLLISDQINSLFPLQSAEMYGLANVSFRGQSASESQKGYLPIDITNFFSNDHATDYYAYSTSREDTAMLFEEAMMSHRYGISRDVGVTDNPNNATASSIIVDWGQRGRIGERTEGSLIPQRAAFVIDEILPELNGSALLATLPEPIAMTQGLSWADNLTLSPQQATKQTTMQMKVSLEDANEAPSYIPELRVSGDRHKLTKHN